MFPILSSDILIGKRSPTFFAGAWQANGSCLTFGPPSFAQLYYLKKMLNGGNNTFRLSMKRYRVALSYYNTWLETESIQIRISKVLNLAK